VVVMDKMRHIYCRDPFPSEHRIKACSRASVCLLDIVHFTCTRKRGL